MRTTYVVGRKVTLFLILTFCSVCVTNSQRKKLKLSFLRSTGMYRFCLNIMWKWGERVSRWGTGHF